MRRWLWMLAMGACAQEPATVAPGGDGPDDIPPISTDSDRDVGPNEDEFGLISAWEILADTVAVEVGELCDTSTADYEAFSASPYVRGSVHHAFFRVEDADSAVNHSCANGYPAGCEPTSLIFEIDGNMLAAESVSSGTISRFPGCNTEATTSFVIEDLGDTGVLTQTVSRSYSEACPEEEASLDGCEVSFTFDLRWTDAR